MILAVVCWFRVNLGSVLFCFALRQSHVVQTSLSNIVDNLRWPRPPDPSASASWVLENRHVAWCPTQSGSSGLYPRSQDSKWGWHYTWSQKEHRLWQDSSASIAKETSLGETGEVKSGQKILAALENTGALAIFKLWVTWLDSTWAGVKHVFF